MRRIAIFLYGVVCYLAFFATFVYAIGFLGNFAVPKSIDSGYSGSLAAAIAIDAALLGLFAIQHSVMARPAFKHWWTQVIPEAAERSTYVLLSSAVLVLLFAIWRPISGTIWELQGVAQAAMYGLFAFGWLTIFVATCLISHFDLFGLRQVYLHLRHRPYESLPFSTLGAYAWVRHPLYIGWFLVMWATPLMTPARLLFASLSTAYILVAIRFEERDLVDHFGDVYVSYQRDVPMIMPRPPSGDIAREPAKAA